MKRHVLGPVADFPPGVTRRVEVAGKAIAVFHEGGKFYALRDVCPHMGARLSDGDVWSAIDSTGPGKYDVCPGRLFVRCPWHGWEYELATGQSSYDPLKDRVRAYAVSVEPGGELSGGRSDSGRVDGPYVAETYSVSVENEYLVVEI